MRSAEVRIGMSRQVVRRHRLVGGRIDRHRVAGGGAIRQRPVHRLGRQHGSARYQAERRLQPVAAARPRRMRERPHVVRPLGERAVGGDAAREPRHHGRAPGLPGHLLLVRPVHAHRPARHRARQQRGIEGHVVGAVVAVAARALRVDDADRIRRNLQRLGEIAAQRERPLRVRPHRELAVLPLRQRAARPDRGVGLEMAAVLGLCVTAAGGASAFTVCSTAVSEFAVSR